MVFDLQTGFRELIVWTRSFNGIRKRSRLVMELRAICTTCVPELPCLVLIQRTYPTDVFYEVLSLCIALWFCLCVHVPHCVPLLSLSFLCASVSLYHSPTPNFHSFAASLRDSKLGQ